MRSGKLSRWLYLLLPIILTTAFVIFGAWRRAVRDADVEGARHPEECEDYRQSQGWKPKSGMLPDAMTDPFADFGDQQFSHELIEKNRGALAEEGRDFIVAFPDIEPIGLILEAGASEAAPFIAAIEQAAGEPLPVPGFLGVVPRHVAVHILRTNCPAALDNLPNNEDGTLPVLVATKGGFRFGEVSV